MTVEILTQLFVATGLASVIGAVVNGYINRRKLGAEATQIIAQAASGVVERLESENARLVLRIERLETSASKHETDFHAHRMVLQLHAAWDHMVMEHLLTCGDHMLPEAPPLYPPNLKETR